jgi:hypothetical protein
LAVHGCLPKEPLQNIAGYVGVGGGGPEGMPEHVGMQMAQPGVAR